MANEVTYNGDADALREALDGGRVIDGPRGTVDVFDDRFGIFRRLDEGDKVREFGTKGYTVEKGHDVLESNADVEQRGAHVVIDTSEAGGFLTAQNPNVQQEVKDGGPTNADKAEGDHVEGTKENSEVSEEEQKKNEDEELSQANAG
jgi:hypothetical protein